MTIAAPSKKEKAKSSSPVRLKQFIGGAWRDGASDKELQDTNPADQRETLAMFRSASQKDALDALAAAQAAYPAWKRTPAPARGRILDRMAKLARERKDKLARILTMEEGKILSEALGEVEKGLNLIEWFAGEGLRFMGTTAPSELPKNLLFTVREPLGVVSIITPWNFPWAIPAWKIAPALVAGNCVVFKPASNTPWLAAEFVKLFEEAGLPPGVLNLVIGSGSAIGNVLVEDPRIQAVSFTGSNSIGQGVHAIAGQRGIRATCEMGGKNPCVVWEDADLDLALPGVMKGAFGSTGQRCTATSRLILHEKVAGPFIDRIIKELKTYKIGDGLKPETSMGPVVDGHQLDDVLGAVEKGKKEATLIYGGNRLKGPEHEHGCFVEPTLFDRVGLKTSLFQEEIFGPVLSVTRVKTFEEAVQAANAVRYGLTSAVYTQDLTLAMRFVEDVEAGMVHVNSPTIGGEAQVPFGGVKASGVGEREMAKEGVMFFSQPKTVFLDYTGQSRKSNIY